MTREVVSVKMDTPLAEVAAAMGQRGISGLPVVSDRLQVAGVVSEKDFLRAMGVEASQNFMTLVASCLRSKGCVGLPHQKTDRRGPHEHAGGDGAAGNPGAGAGRAVCRPAYQPGPGDGRGREPGGDRQPG